MGKINEMMRELSDKEYVDTHDLLKLWVEMFVNYNPFWIKPTAQLLNLIGALVVVDYTRLQELTPEELVEQHYHGSTGYECSQALEITTYALNRIREERQKQADKAKLEKVKELEKQLAEAKQELNEQISSNLV